LIGLLALLAGVALIVCAAAVLAKGREGFVMALVICFVSVGLCLFVYLFFYFLFVDVPQDLRRQRGRRRVLTSQAADMSPGAQEAAIRLLH
jgi:hypothetical protein